MTHKSLKFNKTPRRLLNSKSMTTTSNYLHGMIRKLLCITFCIPAFTLLTSAQSAAVQFIHNSPDNALQTIDVWLNDSLWADNISYLYATPLQSIDSDSASHWEIRDAVDSSITYLDWNTSIAANSKHIFVMHGQWNTELYNPSRSLSVNHFDEALELSASTGSIDVLFFQGTSELDSADIAETQLFELTAFDQLPYGSFSSYINLFSADYGWSILDAGGNETLGEYELPVTSLNWAGKAITIVTSGFVNQANNNFGQPLGMWATTGDGGQMVCLQPLQWNLSANVQFIHNASLPASGNISIETDGSIWQSNLDVHSATPFVSFPAGKNIALEINSNLIAGPLDSIWSDTIHLFSGLNYQFIWFGGEQPENAAQLLIREWEPSPSLSSNQLLLRLFNGGSQQNFMNLLADTTSQTTLFDNIAYGAMSDTLTTWAAHEEWIITTPTDSITAFDAPLDTLNLGGRNVTALTFSESNNPLPSLWLSTELGGPMHPLSTLSIPDFPVFCQVQLVHTSADNLLQNIDVRINESIAVSPLFFESASPFLNVQCNNDVLIQITPHNQPEVLLFSDTIALAPNQTHRLFLFGILDSENYNPAPALDWVEDLSTSLESSLDGNFDVRFFHAATDLGTIDINETTAPILTLFSSISSGELSLAQSLTAGLDFQINLLNTPTQFLYGSYTLPALSLEWENEAITVISTGFRQPANNNNGQILQVWALSPDGSMTPLDNFLATHETHLTEPFVVYPNPASDVLRVGRHANTYDHLAIRVFDSTGKLVLEENGMNDMSKAEITVDVTTLKNGLYTLIADDRYHTAHFRICVYR